MISDVYATSNISFGNHTLKFYRLLSIFCMSLMVVEMIIKIIMKAANLMCWVIHDNFHTGRFRSGSYFGKTIEKPFQSGTNS